MVLDADAAYLALTSRDARFDGRIFVGVTSTGIYCRPICRVRTPLRRNCRFFTTPAQAEAEKFRPCLKCRPEIAPGAGLAWSVMDASSTLARQAAGLLDAQTADGHTPSLAALAQRLGISDRHLRRIFVAEHGVAPLQYLQTRRLLLAKQLLTDSRLPVSQVAFASGYNSLRRFNAAFIDAYRMNPGRLRGAVGAAGVPQACAARARHALGVDVTLAYREPFDVAALLRFFETHPVPGVEQLVGRTVRRTVRAGTLADAAGWVEVEFSTTAASVRLRFAPELAGASRRVVAAVRRWLDLDAAPATIDAALADLPGAPGLRLPASLDAFELAVRAVLGQQVTVVAAGRLAHKLIVRFGSTVATPWPELNRLFPAPDALAVLAPERIAELGIIRSRARAIVALAQAWPAIAEGQAPHAPAEPLIARLDALPGIGPWTAHYIAMRAFAWPDAFPPNDVALLRALRQRFGTASQREADALAERWRPWRSYAVLRLWNSLGTPP